VNARRALTAYLSLVAMVMVTALAVLTTPVAAQADPAADATAGKLLLMLDASGSMKAKDPSGLTKIAAAKKALTSVVGALPTDAQVGLRVYGATQPGVAPGVKPGQAACTDTQLVAPITTLDKPALTKAINGFAAKGETPISYSLTQALKDLGPTGKRNIVLVSDGEESCVPDPCPVIKKLIGNGIDLQIDTVGFGVNAKARKQLQCLASTGKGTYYDAKNADQLTASLNKVSQRATRPFAFTGTPIKGVDVAEDAQVPPGAPELSPGQFTDALTSGQERWRGYTIKRTLPQSTLHLAFATKPTTWQIGSDTIEPLESLYLRVIAGDGTTCVDTFTNRGDGVGVRPVAAVTARLLGQSYGDRTLSEACTGTGPFSVLVRREGAMATTPTEITVIEEPRVTNLTSLPAPMEKYPKEADLPKGPEQIITGGLAFSDAPEIGNGTWVDTIVPGETLVYRVKVEQGQTVRFTVHGPTGGFRFPDDDHLGRGVLWIGGNPFSPDRQTVGNHVFSTGSFSSALGSDAVSSSSAVVRYTNRYIQEPAPDNIRSSSMGGWYYYALGVGTKGLGQDLAGVPIKVAFSVKVEGEPTEVRYDGADAPVTTTAAPTPTDTAPADSSAGAAKGTGQGTTPWLWVGVAALVALGGAGAVMAARRRGVGPDRGGHV
jgi:Ca-activated chloride channel family protein